MSSKKPSGKTQRSAIADVVAREYTIHMHKRVRFLDEESSTIGAPDQDHMLMG
jgi:ABC-type hemin transport system ATPase subunit